MKAIFILLLLVGVVMAGCEYNSWTIESQNKCQPICGNLTFDKAVISKYTIDCYCHKPVLKGDIS